MTETDSVSSWVITNFDKITEIIKQEKGEKRYE